MSSNARVAIEHLGLATIREIAAKLGLPSDSGENKANLIKRLLADKSDAEILDALSAKPKADEKPADKPADEKPDTAKSDEKPADAAKGGGNGKGKNGEKVAPLPRKFVVEMQTHGRLEVSAADEDWAVKTYNKFHGIIATDHPYKITEVPADEPAAVG